MTEYRVNLTNPITTSEAHSNMASHFQVQFYPAYAPIQPRGNSKSDTTADHLSATHPHRLLKCDSRICQTSIATPAKPGGLPLTLVGQRAVVISLLVSSGTEFATGVAILTLLFVPTAFFGYFILVHTSLILR